MMRCRIPVCRGRSKLYHEQYPVQSTDNPYSYEWPFSQAHVATLDLLGTPKGWQFADDLRIARRAGALLEGRWRHDRRRRLRLVCDRAYGGGGDMFYDDNEWVGLEKSQQYLMTGDRSALHRPSRSSRWWCLAGTPIRRTPTRRRVLDAGNLVARSQHRIQHARRGAGLAALSGDR